MLARIARWCIIGLVADGIPPKSVDKKLSPSWGGAHLDDSFCRLLLTFDRVICVQ